ncbi:MAG: type II-B CRISPR-associated RNA-guided endonuclease Cas9/Csx12 [Brevinematales bacterium]|nr:type II-B CRISPR-associated RNA-guided endonuclease Cas9/Csx12 [Brevinematales bacterium]
MKIFVSIDQGAKNTGLVLAEVDSNGQLQNLEGNVVSINENEFKTSQLDRRTKRHQRRRYKRRKLAKRLLRLILEKEFGWNFSKKCIKQKEFIFGLLNRRGFSYIVEDLDVETLNNEDFIDFIVKLFPDQLNKDEKLTEQIEKNYSNPEWFKSILDNPNSKFVSGKNKNSNEQTLEGYCKDKNLKYSKELERFYNKFIGTISQFYDEMSGGAKHRKKYFEEIKTVIYNSNPLDEIFRGSKIDEKKFFKIVAHISNFPLRVLRKYFNDKKMKDGGYWDDKRLKKIFLREVRSWHTSGNNELKKRRKRLISLLTDPNKGILEFWFELDPIETIPPYEDMNNRNIPLCQTLYLDPEKLNEKFKGWKAILNKLLEEEKDSKIKEGLLENKWDSIEKHKIFYHDLYKKCHLKLKPKISKDDLLARTLQRFFDRVRDKDPYKFRLIALSKKVDSDEYKDAINNLKKVICENEIEILKGIAKTYYAEQENAKKGLWDEKNSILKKCNLHTKHKINLSHIIIGDILDVRMSPKETEDFYNFLKNTRIERKTLIGIASECSEILKKEGNTLRASLETVLYYNNNERELDKKQEYLFKIYELVEKGAKEIGNYLGKNNSSRYADIWSFAQIYNVLEGDRHGFSKICEICHEENALRSSVMNEEGATFTRLFADSVRPFDGVVARLISKQADVISGLIIKKIGSLKVNNDEEINISLIAEQNEFLFEEELSSLKGKTSDKDKSEYDSIFNNKLERIKSFNTYCPYTGEKIGDNGDIDHILPRSWTKRVYGAIFNDEMNLIYSSTRGNRESKANRPDGLWDFENLSDSFLSELYDGITDRETIKNTINNTLEKLGILNGERKDKIVFLRLDKDTQRDLKVALFTPEFRDKLIPYLNNSLSAKVNGTQAYLLKLIIKRLREKYPNLKATISRVDSSLIQKFRNDISKEDPALSKNRENQSLYSHTVDASIALFFNTEESDFKRCLPPGIKIIEAKARSQIHKIKKGDFYSTSVFKDGIYGEKFVPVILFKEKLYFGFDTKNCVEILNEKETIFDLLKPYLRYRNDNKKIVKAFEKSFEDWKNISKNKFLRFFVDKIAAFEFFEKVAKQPSDDMEKVTFHLLEGLRYTTQKIEIMSLLIDSNGKKYKTKEKILSKENFNIEINISPLKIENEDIKIEGSLTFPARTFLEKIVDSDEIKNKLGNDVKNKEEDFKSINKFLKNLYGRKNESDPRVKARKVFSVDIIKNPSGGFRIKRKTPDGTIYQLVEIKDRATIGFEVRDGKIDKNSAILHPVLYNDRNIVPVGALYKESPKNSVLMDDWREITLEDDEKKFINRLWVCPGTKSRSYYRIELLTEQFKKSLFNNITSFSISQDKQDEFYKILPLKLKFDLDKIDFLKDDKIRKILVGPRSSEKNNIKQGSMIVFEATSEHITLEYEANGFMPEEAQRRYLEVKK